MKVTNWKTLAVVVFMGGGALIYCAVNRKLFWFLLFAYLVVKGLFTSFSQELYDEEIKKAKIESYYIGSYLAGLQGLSL